MFILISFDIRCFLLFLIANALLYLYTKYIFEKTAVISTSFKKICYHPFWVTNKIQQKFVIRQIYLFFISAILSIRNSKLCKQKIVGNSLTELLFNSFLYSFWIKHGMERSVKENNLLNFFQMDISNFEFVGMRRCCKISICA